jgi:phosphoadenosine phosphosulfate reductase
MSLLTELRSETAGMSTADCLRHLIVERFPGRCLVSASLRASSQAVLRMVADIDPATPVVFCKPGFLLPESRAYRQRIVKLFGLTNVSVSQGGEAEVQAGDLDHYERMWSETDDGFSRIFEIVQLNRTLADYDCWISAVYHMGLPAADEAPVEREGRLIRVNPLSGWTRSDVRDFLNAQDIPFHPRAHRPPPKPVVQDDRYLPMFYI